jgi:hypothetical protein
MLFGNRRRTWIDHARINLYRQLEKFEKSWPGKITAALVYLALCLGAARVGYAYFFE